MVPSKDERDEQKQKCIQTIKVLWEILKKLIPAQSMQGFRFTDFKNMIW